jgi:hypothetical protein
MCWFCTIFSRFDYRSNPKKVFWSFVYVLNSRPAPSHFARRATLAS